MQAPPASDYPQRRARETRSRLVSGARDLFAERGYDAVQTPDIARRAGVSVGTFYRYFADKKAIFLEMARANLDEAYTRIMENLTPEVFAKTRSAADRRRAVDHVLEVLFENAREHPGINREFQAVALRDPEVAAVRNEFELRGRDAIAWLLEQVVPGDLPNPRAAAEVMQIAAREIALAMAASERPRAEVEALRDALADMIHRFVFRE